MNFSTPEKVTSVIRASDEVERYRGENRAKINNLFNGIPLLSEAAAKKINLKVNCNFGEAAVLGQHGRRQYANAFQNRGNFFKVRLPDAPTDKKLSWETFITRKINRIMKRSRKYFELGRSKWASTLLHGIGPQVWEDAECWCPSYIALEDLRIATNTMTSFENLVWFGIRKQYTPGELAKKAFGPNADRGWNKPTIQKILKEYQDLNFDKTDFNWIDNPEKMWELFKQNFGFYVSDAVPTIPLWHFYYLDDENPRKSCWRLLVVPTAEVKGSVSSYDEFIFDGRNKDFAKDIGHIIHCQFGDLNNKAPFLYHSVRSLGFLLMEPCYWSNLFVCRFLQHAFESFNIWLRNTDPAGKAKAQKLELFDRAWIPEGVSVVPNTERHQIDPGVVEMVMSKMKSLKQEASISYTQDTEGGRSPDETATAVMARVSSVNAMMSGLLNTAVNYETFSYEEICRRFCIRKSGNKDVRDFQSACLKFGIPSLYLNVEYWEVEPDMPMGAGNPTMEQAQANQLLGMRPLFGTEAQQEILHEATIAFTGDPRKAERWAPIDKVQGVTDAQRDAEFAFGVLMQGAPVRMKAGLNPIDQIETLLGLMAGVIARIEKSGGMATPGELVGLQTVGSYVGQLIAQLSQNPQEKQRVKEYSDALGKLNNALKGFGQRLAEQNGKQNGNGIHADNAAKIEADLIAAQTKAKIAEHNAAQKREHKEKAFDAEQLRKNISALNEIERANLKAEIDGMFEKRNAVSQ